MQDCIMTDSWHLKIKIKGASILQLVQAESNE